MGNNSALTYELTIDAEARCVERQRWMLHEFLLRIHDCPSRMRALGTWRKNITLCWIAVIRRTSRPYIRERYEPRIVGREYITGEIHLLNCRFYEPEVIVITQGKLNIIQMMFRLFIVYLYMYIYIYITSDIVYRKISVSNKIRYELYEIMLRFLHVWVRRDSLRPEFRGISERKVKSVQRE